MFRIKLSTDMVNPKSQSKSNNWDGMDLIVPSDCLVSDQ